MKIAVIAFLSACIVFVQPAPANPTQESERYATVQIIPDFVEYDAPAPFFRAHKVGDAPASPRFLHPQNGNYEAWGELKFSFRPVGVWMGEGKQLFQREVSWRDLRSQIQRVARVVEGSAVLSEQKVCGVDVLVLDYRQKSGTLEQPRETYITKLWFPVDDHVVLEALIFCTSDEWRVSLRDRLLSMKIHKSKLIPAEPSATDNPDDAQRN